MNEEFDELIYVSKTKTWPDAIDPSLICYEENDEIYINL